MFESFIISDEEEILWYIFPVFVIYGVLNPSSTLITNNVLEFFNLNFLISIYGTGDILLQIIVFNLNSVHLFVHPIIFFESSIPKKRYPPYELAKAETSFAIWLFLIFSSLFVVFHHNFF